MTSIGKWVAGAGSAGLTWTAITSTELNSAAAGAFKLGTVEVDNGTDLNLFMDLSGKITLASAATIGDYITLYLLPKNQDNTLYGSGESSGTTSPDSKYYIDRWTTTSTGTTLSGQTNRIIIPPGKFVLGVTNNCTPAFSATPGSVYYRVYNYNLNG